MSRPEYVHGSGEPSIETWEVACRLSQAWAEEARRAADRRRMLRMAIVSGLLFAILIFGITMLSILIIGN